MFYNASIIIGPHGMGFANMMASRPGTMLIEYLPWNKPVMCFGKMSQALGIQYHGMMYSKEDRHDTTLTAQIEKTVELLQMVL